MVGYLFGGNTNISYDELQKRRAVVDAMMVRQASSAPQNVGEGLLALGQGLMAGLEKRQLRQVEQKGRGDALEAQKKAIASILPPASSTAAPDIAAVAAAAETPVAGGVTRSPLPPISASGTAPVVLPNDPNLPAGMRNNNPGNIKFVGQGRDRGVLGPSKNTDQGDPQAVFETPEAGMREMYNLLNRKYAGGKVTPNMMIAGNGGWTPGNRQAAANVARYAGIGPDDDIGLNDPASAAKFMRGLLMQEHGKASNAYTDDMIMASIGGGSAPASTSGPVQVASLDAPGATANDATAPAPNPVQRVAQAMPTIPTAPTTNIPPEAIAALQNPYLTDGEKKALEIGIQQRQAGNKALYDRQMAQYEQQMKRWEIDQQQGYQDRVRQEGFARDDRRNSYLDARQGSRDARSDMESDRNFDRQVRQDQKPQIIEVFDEKTGRAQKGYMDQDGRFMPVGGVQAPTKSNGVVVRGPDGSLVQVGGDTPALTETQSKDTVYSTRAKGALTTLDKYAPALTNRWDLAKDYVPGGLGRGSQNKEYQLAQQAGDEFLQAILRKDTGAGITSQEQSLYGNTYLPRPGDSEELLTQKQQSRSRALAAIEAGMPPSAIVAQELALRKTAGEDKPKADADGWQTLPNGVRMRVKP